MSGAAALPEAELFPEIRLLLSKTPLVRVNCAAWGRFCSGIPTSFYRSHLSGAAALPVADLVPRNLSFFGRNHLSGAAALPGAEFFSGISMFLKKPLVWGSCAAWGRTFSQKSVFFGRSHLSGQLRCLGQSFFSEICLFGKKPLVWAAALPGVEFSQKSVF